MKFYVCCLLLTTGKVLRGGNPFTDVNMAHDAVKRNNQTSPHLSFWVEDEIGLMIESPVESPVEPQNEILKIYQKVRSLFGI